MCGRFIAVDRSIVECIAAEIERDLSKHADELGSIDPIESYEGYLGPPGKAQASLSCDMGARQTRHPDQAARSQASFLPTTGAQQTSLFEDEARPCGRDEGLVEQGSPEVSLFKEDEGEPEAGLAASTLGRREVFPASTVPLIVATGHGSQLAIVDMTWGFDVTWKRGPVFNTRIETALGEKGSMWSQSFGRRRCLVPAWGFYEWHATEKVISRRSGRPVKRQYCFELPKGAPMLMAGIHDKGRFSLVTTIPNASVAPIHKRMPLVLGKGEPVRWICGQCGALADRGHIALLARPEG